jgi:hypothetical protein
MRATSPCSTPRTTGAAGRAADVRAARAVAIAENLRALRRDPAAPAGPELAAAQASLERRIRAHLPRGTVRVTLTDNRYTMISVRRPPARGRGAARPYDLRLHHMFADSDPAITRALALYVVANDRDASRVLGDFIDANAERVAGRGRRGAAAPVVTAGEVHDLEVIFDRLNARYFGGTIEAAITWGPRSGRPRRRNSIKMGSYAVEDRLIRIHRSLDRAFVPEFFVEWVVFHEMLHQVHDIKVRNGRREFHSDAFLADEARFERFEEAAAWERQHVEELLTY